MTQVAEQWKAGDPVPRLEPAAAFLLDWDYPNLFDPTGSPSLSRCKGCPSYVRVGDRRAHFQAHKKGGVAPAVPTPVRANVGGSEYPATGDTSSVRPKGGPIAKEGGTNMAAKDKTVKPSKIKVARETAVAILVKAAKPMKMEEIVEAALKNAKVKELDIPKGTIVAQVSNALREDTPRIVRVDRGTYAAVGVKVVQEAPAPTPEPAAVAAKAKTTRSRSTAKPAAQVEPDPKPATNARRRRSSRSSGAAA